MNPLLETLENVVRHAQETWEDEAFQQRLQEARERLEILVSKNPVGSIGIALLAGFIIGKIIHKGSDE